LFFAVHELCALTIPEVLTVNDPTPLGRKLFETDVRHLYKAFVRGRKLKSEADVCCLCMDIVESHIKLHSVIKLDCCGLRFYHFDCMKSGILLRAANSVILETKVMTIAWMERSCMSTIGPDKYDDSDALNDSVFNPLEALNACITCGVHCHRICAGPPWSTFTPDGDGDEQKWQCEDCRCGFPVSFLSE
uniref:PHD domain-containing protein n=1 Tax=Heligmosomoides polygyrus TaxID=6339 RepID=A0A183FV28_HELPZ